MRRIDTIDGLELISHEPAFRSHPVPLLFVHGAFAGAWCWDEYFMPYLAERGYASHALSLRGHSGSAGRGLLQFAGIDDYEADVLRVVRHIGSPLVAVGHSMGGMVVQRCLHRIQALGAVLMAPVPPEGLLGSSLLLALRDPLLLHGIGAVQARCGDRADLRTLRRAVFSAALPESEAVRHLARMQPESHRALLDLSWPQHLFIRHAGRVPLLVMGGADDAVFPPPMIASTARFHGAQTEILDGLAHAMMLDSAWRMAADCIVAWVTAMRFGCD